MKLSVTLAALALLVPASTAFVPAHPRFATVEAQQNKVVVGSSSALAMSTETTPCDTPQDVVEGADLVSQKGSAKILRSAVLTNADGKSIQLGDYMGDETSIVVFLRHLG